MIVTCPECQTRYLVNPTVLRSDGRTVRCARCAHTWRQKRAADAVIVSDPPPAPLAPAIGGWATEAEEAPAASVENESLGQYRFQPPAVSVPKPSFIARWGGWIGLVGVILAVSLGLILFQQSLIKAWPPVARLYRSVGLISAEEAKPLDIVNVMMDPSRPTPDSPPNLIVSGDVKNGTATTRPVPKLRVVFRDDKNKIIHEEEFGTDKTSLNPGESAHFQVTMPEQPSAKTGIVTFTE